MRKFTIWVGVLGAVLLAAVGAVPAIGSGNHPTPDVQLLFGQAIRHVRAAGNGTFAEAVMYEADGTTAAGRTVKTAAGITRWRFVLQNPTPGSSYADATVTDGPAPRGFGPVVGHTAPFLEDLVITQAPKISLAKAVTRLDAAGDTSGFTSVTLRNPLGPGWSGTTYIFATTRGDVAVNATTGKVKRVV